MTGSEKQMQQGITRRIEDADEGLKRILRINNVVLTESTLVAVFLLTRRNRVEKTSTCRFSFRRKR
jgi:hypothetical protein